MGESAASVGDVACRADSPSLDAGRGSRIRRDRRRVRSDHRRRRAGRPDRRLRAEQARQVLRRPRGRPADGRRHQPDRPVQGLSLRHRRPPILLQERRDQPALARDPGRRIPHAQPAQPHLLRPQVLPLSAQARSTPCGSWDSCAPAASWRATSRPGSARSSPSGASRIGSSIASAASSSRSSSSRTPRRSGGCPPSTISADWAAQRIKDLDLVRAVTSALFGRWSSKRGEVIKTLIDQFQYPAARPGPDVGGRPGSDPLAGRGGPARPPRGPDRARRVVGDRLPDPRRRGPADPLPRPPLPLDPAGPRADPGHESAAARPR